METTSINVKIKTNKTKSLFISYLLYIFVPPAKELNGEGIKFSFEAFIDKYTEIAVYRYATQKSKKAKSGHITFLRQDRLVKSIMNDPAASGRGI